MISLKVDSRKFRKEMDNILKYSEGFLEGANAGKRAMFAGIGERTVQIINQYIDSSARVNPALLHHVYEWYQTGSPDARLFDIEYTVSNLGLSFKSSFRQSTSIKNGSYDPFVNKAKIMENGVTVTIRPKRREFLKFEVNGETVFSRGPITVQNPGGPDVQRGFERTFDEFFQRYFTQAFLDTSGIGEHLRNPIAYKRDLPKGRQSGRNAGVAAGYRWVANAGVSK